MTDKLTPKQARFVEQYLLDLNATQAAIRAGYSPKTARQAGTENLAKPAVSSAIAAAQQERSQRTQIDSDWLLTRLADEAEADLADLYEADGTLKPVHQWPPVWRKGLVAGIEVLEEFEGSGRERKSIGVVRKVKLADRVKVKELIGRHVNVGAFRDNVAHSGPKGGPIPVATIPCTPAEFKTIAAELAREV